MTARYPLVLNGQTIEELQDGDSLLGDSDLGTPTGGNLANCSFPTLNQNTSGTAAKATILATPRALYGNNFDGSAALNQIITSQYGGTGNGFAKFTGPATSEKTFTLPNANGTLLVDGGALGTPASGTLTHCTGLPQAGLATNVAGNGPAFSAYANTTQSISALTLTKALFQTEDFDTNSNFATSTFTPTVAGYYWLSALILISSGTMGNSQIHFYKNGASCVRPVYFTADFLGLTGSALIYCNGSTDFIEIYFKNANACILWGATGDASACRFSGFLARCG
jgi:hypothetical protein